MLARDRHCRSRPRCASESTARLPKWKRLAASRSRKPGLAPTRWAPCMLPSGLPGSAAKACSSSSCCGRIPFALSFTLMTRRSPASGRMATEMAASSSLERVASALPLSGGREVRVGGYGFPISDEGSGADLGLHAIRLALRAYDERAVGTSLTRDVMMRFHNDPFEVVAWMDHATATDYATFAPLVMRHADAGDPVARRIVRDAAEQIDELVRRLSECGASRIALLGGLASSMQPWLAPDVQRRLVPVEGDAVDGALHLARRAVMKG